MDKFGLIGHPIGHSLSPRLFSAAYHGRYAYELIETSDFDEAWATFLRDYKAINVTAPFKGLAFERADWKSEECLRVGATNLCVKTPEGVKAYNSDYMGVKSLLEELLSSDSSLRTAAVVGFGGAGKASKAAAEDAGLETVLYRHAEIADGISADVVIYTLPKAVEGIDRIECRHIIEANYKDPCLSSHPGYIPGTVWHLRQAILGYSLMSGDQPDPVPMKEVYRF